MTTNIVTAAFGAFRVTRTRQLYQYDYGQILRFAGIELPASYTVHFSNQQIGGEAVKQVGDADGVQIPDEMLTSGQNVYAWVFLHVGADDGETMYAVTIPVQQRPKPTEEEPTPVQQGLIEQAIAALNEAVDQTAADVQTTGEAVTAAETAQTAAETAAGQAGAFAAAADTSASEAAQSAANARQNAINAGMSATSAESAATAAAQSATDASDSANTASSAAAAATEAADAAENARQAVQDMGVEAETLAPGSAATVEKAVDPETGVVTLEFGIPAGKQGIPGEDGFSPTITVTDIAGGHRVTITDETGPHNFDVMDGTGSVQDVQVAGVSVVQDGVANVPKGTNNSLGVVKAATSLGTIVNSDGTLYIYGANPTNIKAGNSWQLPIVTVHQHESTFYGLAKAAGSDEKDSTLPVGQYTDAAKSAISQMFNGSVAVTGTTPNITALPGVRYVCGEVSTLDITLPASGIVDVTFTSGSTATVLTITPPSGVTLKWANGFDPSALEANTTYELNIMDGLGVAMRWS